MFYVQKIIEIDIEIEKYYKSFEPKSGEVIKDNARKHGHKPKFNLQQELYNITGIDFSTIPGVHTLTVQTIIS